jgi:hypothetical protein
VHRSSWIAFRVANGSKEGAGNTQVWKWTSAANEPMTQPKQWYSGLGMQMMVF